MMCTYYNLIPFSPQDNGDLEPVINEKHFVHDGLRTHFPKMNQTASSSNILCQNCTENQQKIIQLLHSFEIPILSSMNSGRRKQYEDYVIKLEKRYPLCATCSFRVQVQLKKCDEEASLSERRKTAQSGEDWQNKLNLAQRMKWKHARRKIVKGIFFWPDFLFQLVLTFKCVMKSQMIEKDGDFNNFIKFDFIDGKDLKIWAPNNLNFSSNFLLLLLILFSIQFHGIALSSTTSSSSSFSRILPQLFLLISRCFVGNFLFRCDKSVLDLNSVLTLTAIGLAVIFKTGSKNAFISSSGIVRRPFTNEINTIILSKQQPQSQPDALDSRSIFKRSTVNSISISNKRERGFAAYSDNHHAFHSFANQVPENVTKPIMPWPDKPLPSQAFNSQNDPFRKFNENMSNYSTAASTFNNVNNSLKIKPTRLDVCDSLELEPMFSSFSLSDEPEITRNNHPPRSRRVILPVNNIKSPSVPSGSSSNVSNFMPSSNNNVSRFITGKSANFVINQEILKIGYNCLLTVMLSICRLSLPSSSSPLVTIILALAFGLRGFIWPRLILKHQLFTLAVAVGRLGWLAAEINGKIQSVPGGVIGYLALALDLILIILR